MLTLFLVATLIGPSLNASLNRTIRYTTYMLDVGYKGDSIPEGDSEHIANNDGRVPANCTQDQQMTRHSTGKGIHPKALVNQYKQKCKTSNSGECVKLFNRLVKDHIQQTRYEKKIRSFPRSTLDFRLCLNGFDIVHYDTDTQICCNGVFNNTSGTEECCLGEIIDSTKQFCCNDILHNRTESDECCGTNLFDTRINICCSGNLHTKLPGAACCGNDVFNKKTEICCFESYKFKLTEGNACCGTSVYNPSTDTCCQNNVQPAYGKKNRKGSCCKDKSYHAKCFKCKNDAQLVAVFNESSEVCCDGMFRKKKYGNTTGCCWRQVMDTEKQQCYDKKIIDKLTSIPMVHTTISDMARPDTPYHEEHTTILLTAMKASSDHGHIIIIVCGLTTLIGVGCGAVCIAAMKKPGVSKSVSEDEKNFRTNNATDNCQPNNVILSNDQRSAGNYSPSIDILSTDQTNRICKRDDFAHFNESDLFSEIDSLNYARFMQSRADIVKAPLVHDENFLTSYVIDSCTQTCTEKACNRRTIFGKPFEHNYILGVSNATVQMPSSEVKMTLPQSVLRHSEVEVNCTSFKIISQLRKKLGLGDDEAIASPVVEYAVTGKGLLSNYAVVIIPFIGPTTDLSVRKFQSDEGLNTVVNSTNVPLQEYTTEDHEAFYIIKDSDIYVYTKSFSGFYCTTCRHRPLRIRCFLFGSYKRFTNPLRHEVRVMIYLADELLKFSDYKERMLTNENAEGRVWKKEIQLQLPSELSEIDEIQASVMPTESHNGQWIHKLYPGEPTPIYNELQTVTLEYVAEKCKGCPHCHLPEHDIPHGMEWYLTNVDGILPSYSFQCIVNVDIVHHTSGTRTSNRIVIDELQLRQEDRFPIEEEFDARCIRGIKEYLAGSISNEKRNAVLSALLSKYSCSGSSVEEVFFHLLEKLTPKGVLDAVVNVLKSYQMFEDLDTLQKYGLVSRGLAFSAVPPVNDLTTEETELHEESTEVYTKNQ